MKRVYPLAALMALLAPVLSGCSKTEDAIFMHPTPSPAVVFSDSLIVTPFGMLPASEVHFIAEGSVLTYSGHHLQQRNARSGALMHDYGVQERIIKTSGSLSPYFGHDTLSAPPKDPVLGSGWITYAATACNAPTGYFSTDWVVPSHPPAYHGQLIYIFNGMQDGYGDSAHIIQPVLQYGPNGAWGGDYWTVNNWYVGCSGCAVYYGKPASVTPGTVLRGEIFQEASESGELYNVRSKFTVSANSDNHFEDLEQDNGIVLQHVPMQRFAFEAIEAYHMKVADNYPKDAVCKMYNILLKPLSNGPSNPPVLTPDWRSYNVITDVGQHTTVVSPAEVDLYFH